MFGKLFKALFGGSDDNGSQYNRSYNYNNAPSTPSPRPSQTQPVSRKVVDSAYISNLRIGRSWILPQMVRMSFDGNGNFSESLYYQAVQRMHYDKCWEVMIRNYRALYQLSTKDPVAYAQRATWWNKDLAMIMVKHDVALLEREIASMLPYAMNNCTGGPYIKLSGLRGRHSLKKKLFFVSTPNPASKWNSQNSMTIDQLRAEFACRVSAIESAATPQMLYQTLRDYNNHRCLVGRGSIPEAFVNAFAGDGAYTAMMTMVKYLNLYHLGSREACLADIEAQAKACNHDGRKLYGYCAQRFFDRAAGGVFDYNTYMRRR